MSSPESEGDPYYPVPRPENAALYKQYEALAQATPNVHFVGRLATYKYYNMDQVVAQALNGRGETSWRASAGSHARAGHCSGSDHRARLERRDHRHAT